MVMDEIEGQPIPVIRYAWHPASGLAAYQCVEVFMPVFVNLSFICPAATICLHHGKQVMPQYLYTNVCKDGSDTDQGRSQCSHAIDHFLIGP